MQRIALGAALLPQAQALSDEAGWNQNAADWLVFQRHGEIFGVMAGERLVATAAILPYGEDFAWISMVPVTAEFRRRGLATSLLRHGMARLHAQRRVALLDATEAGEPVYRALGFSTLTRMTRWVRAGAHGPKTVPALVGLGRKADREWVEGCVQLPAGGVRTPPPTLGPLCGPSPQGEGEFSASTSPSIRILDCFTFGAPRSFLLDDFLSRPNAGAWSDDKSAVVLRPGRHAWQIGPVIGTPDRARALLTRAIDTARGAIVIDLLEAGADLTPWLTQRGFTPRRGFCRMAHGRDTLPGAPARLLAAAGPEFG